MMDTTSMKEAVIEEYWLKKLAGELPEVSLPLISGNNGKEQEREIRLYSQEIPADVSAKLARAGKYSHKALSILILSGLQIVLRRYTGTHDLVVGTAVPNGKITGDDNRIIFCRNQLPDHMALKEFFMQTKSELLETFNYWEYSLDSLVEALDARNGTSSADIFKVAFLYEPFQTKSQDIHRFELVFIVSAHHSHNQQNPVSGLRLQVQYPWSPRARDIVSRFSQNLITTLRNMLDNADKQLGKLEVISEEEKHELLYDFNATEAVYPQDKTIHRLFAEQVRRTPDSIALYGCKAERLHDGAHVSYGELDEKSTQLAHYLRLKGVKPGTIVAIMVDRSVEMMIGILGILKTGGTYLPLDPDYPEKRITYLLEHSEAELLLSQEPLADRCRDQCPVIDIRDQELYKGQTDTSAPPGNPRDLAYVTYTSGSTGKPKGVMIEHRSLVNFIKGITDIIPFTGEDSILSLTTISFDIFGLETLLPLTTGTPVVIGSRKEQLDALAASRLLVRQRITIFQVTPSRLQLLLLEKEIPSALRSLQVLLVGGEAFPTALLEKVRGITTGKIYNLYGPTETTIWSTIKDVTGTHSLNIGRPIANTAIYILNKAGLIQPVGVPGELTIAGHGVARGYLNHPELTFERFCLRRPGGALFEKTAPPGPPRKNFSLGTGNRIYRSYRSYIYHTGDLARWLPDGNVEFLGRMDFQVKIRGFRVELGEIENVLLKHKDIKEAVILVSEAEAASSGSTKSLSAYIVTTREINVSQLREYLSGELPPYMIPSTFIKTDRIPLTPNGKVDRKALTAYTTSGTATILSTGVKYVAPRNDTEKTIANIWREILNLPEVGINENFFDLGGTSLDIYRLNAKFKEVFNEDELVLKIFRYPTIGALAEYINRKKVGIDDYHQLTGRKMSIDKIKKIKSKQKSKIRGNKHVRIH